MFLYIHCDSVVLDVVRRWSTRRVFNLHKRLERFPLLTRFTRFAQVEVIRAQCLVAHTHNGDRFASITGDIYVNRLVTRDLSEWTPLVVVRSRRQTRAADARVWFAQRPVARSNNRSRSAAIALDAFVDMFLICGVLNERHSSVVSCVCVSSWSVASLRMSSERERHILFRMGLFHPNCKHSLLLRQMRPERIHCNEFR